MKKIILLTILLIFMTGCANPFISTNPSFVTHSGDKTTIAVNTDNSLIYSNYENQSDEYVDEYASEYGAYDSDLVADPLEGFNRMMTSFNHDLYYAAIKPTADAFRFVVPEEIRVSTSNFFRNLAFPVRFLNCVLQGKFDRAVDEFHAFFLNTTVGVLGLGDAATSLMGRSIPKENFGQTLGYWGFGNGFYIVLPILGPMTLRNGIGMVGDLAADPVTWIAGNNFDWPVTAGARVVETVNYFSFQKDVYKSIDGIALDPYVAIRNGYIQNDNKNIAE